MISVHSHEVIHKYLGGISRWVIKPALCTLRRAGAPPPLRHAAGFGNSSRLSPRCPRLPYRCTTQLPDQLVEYRRGTCRHRCRPFLPSDSSHLRELRRNSNCGCSNGQCGISKPKMSGCPNPVPGLYSARPGRALHGSPTEPGKEALVTGTFVVESTPDVNDDRLDRADIAESPNPKRRR